MAAAAAPRRSARCSDLAVPARHSWACGLTTWRPHATHALRTGRSHSFAGQLAGLLHPSGELSLVEPVVLVDVEVARVLALGLARGDWTQRHAAEESHLDVLREAMDAKEPGLPLALALDSVQRRVPFDRLAHAGDGAHDERVEAAPDVAFPARHQRVHARLRRAMAAM